MNPFEGIGRIVSAALAGDVWMLKPALQQPGVWVLGLAAVVLGGLAVMALYKAVPFVERYLEPTIMVTSYLAIGGIIFVEVIRRFVFQLQAPWSTTVPPFLFLIMTWAGCSYNVKLRTHLAFTEFRGAAPRAVRFAFMILDSMLWLGLSWVIVVTSTRVVVNSAANFQIMLGTDNVMQWWFLISLPITFILLSGRVFENLFEDVRDFRTGHPLVRQAVIGGD